MRRNLLTALMLLFVAMTVQAVPARPGLWKTITARGVQLRVELCGDERGCYWRAEDGRCFIELPDGTHLQQSQQQLQAARRASMAPSAQLPKKAQRPQPPHKSFQGKKKGLIILAEFQNKKFLPEHDHQYFLRVANERGFSEGDYRGSVKDYFLSQSHGLFELDFDVVGPVTVSHDYEYYGQPGATNVDAHPWEMVVEACNLVDGEVNYADYDWNGDGYVEQVFVLYAGQGQSDSYDQNTIWPHEYELHSITENGIHIYGSGHHTADGPLVDTYACSNELTSKNTPSGIGTICHEFSHCMGLPDLYDVDYNGYFGMGHWSLMANGVYNGNAFTPAGYTSYERMVCGWQQPIVLHTDTVVEAMRPLSEGGDSYIIYNEGHPDEYYLLENRQGLGWDSALPAAGLLVLHVDYDERVWRENIVNTVCDYRGAGLPDHWNTHQRLTLIHADNENDRRYWHTDYYLQTTEDTDPYPYWAMVGGQWSAVNDSLTCNSIPAASVYNANSNGSIYMNRALQAISRHDDGTIGFRFEADNRKYVATDTTMTGKPDLTGAIFYESFDRCEGTGGNDGVFKGSVEVASADFLPDNDGWLSDVMKGGARCAKFGNAAIDGIVTMPAIMLTGQEMVLCFKAAPWGRDDTSLTLTATGGAQIATTQFEMTEGQWTTFSTVLTGSGRTQITFTPGRRFFLDEVVVRPNKDVNDGMRGVEKQGQPCQVYDLYGRPVVAGSRSAHRVIFLQRLTDGTVKKVIR